MIHFKIPESKSEPKQLRTTGLDVDSAFKTQLRNAYKKTHNQNAKKIDASKFQKKVLEIYEVRQQEMKKSSKQIKIKSWKDCWIQKKFLEWRQRGTKQ